MMFETVQEFFEADFEYLAPTLEHSEGDFWERVQNNTITNAELYAGIGVDMATGRFNSKVFQASVALAAGRLAGKVANPG